MFLGLFYIGQLFQVMVLKSGLYRHWDSIENGLFLFHLQVVFN